MGMLHGFSRNSEAICHFNLYICIYILIYLIHLFTKDAGLKYVHVLSDCKLASEHPPEVHLMCSGSSSKKIRVHVRPFQYNVEIEI